MKSVKCILLIAGLFCSAIANAQVTDLRLDPASLAGLPNTIYRDSAYTITVVIHNDSSLGFSGKITIEGTIQGVFSYGISDTEIIYYPDYANQDTIPPNDTIQRLLVINVTTVSGIIGSSGVVIWPIATQHNHPVNISDTISKIVNVLYPAGIDEITARELRVYMNGQQLIIQNNGAYPLKNVQLYDIAGNLLQEQRLSISGAISMEQYATGIYFADITFEDNTRVVVKIANTR